MTMDIEEIIRLIAAPFDLTPLSPEVVVYGAGNTGCEVGAFLHAAGHRVAAYLDAAARPHQQLHGVPVQRPSDWTERHPTAGMDVVVAIHNFEVDMVEALAQVRRLEFRRTLNMIDFHNLFPNWQPFRYWLAPRVFYCGHEREIEEAFLLLGDETSRLWYREVLAFRLSGDYSRLPSPSLEDQYVPRDLPRWKNPMRLIDCGAYDGDTIEALAGANYSFEAIAAFEPEPQNFKALAARARRYGLAVCFPCGVADGTRMVRFLAGAGMGSREAADGNAFIQCVALDEALAGFHPTHIKMDIEGAEPDALAGARRMIEDDLPTLAIALYHQPDHLWRIPLIIAGWKVGYRMEIRGHAFGSFDTVLYAFHGNGHGHE